MRPSSFETGLVYQHIQGLLGLHAFCSLDASNINQFMPE